MKEKIVTGFDRVGDLPILAVHCFTMNDDGKLYHSIDGRVRAIIDAEGIEAYVQKWPDAADVVAGITVGVPVEPTEPVAPVEPVA